jgi:hypothetical protein
MEGHFKIIKTVLLQIANKVVFSKDTRFAMTFTVVTQPKREAQILSSSLKTVTS